MPSPSWRALLDFLDQPAVAVRVTERKETVVIGPPRIEAGCLSFRSEVERLAHIDSTIDELSPRGLDVGRDQVYPLVCARRHLRDPRADLNRAFRSRRCQLHDAVARCAAMPEAQGLLVGRGAMIDVLPEAQRLHVELLRTIHIRDRYDDGFQFKFHSVPP